MVTATKPRKPKLEPVGKPETHELRALVEMYYDIQKFRKAGQQRDNPLMKAERLEMAVAMLKDLEGFLVKEMATVLPEHPVSDWLLGVRGIGPTMAAALLASGLDPAIDKPSAWWRFAGVGVVDGKNQRLRRGQKRSYNGFLRRTLYVLMGQFLKAHTTDKPSFYADLYYRFKEESERDRPEANRMACPGTKAGSKKVACEGAGCSRCGGTGIVATKLHHHARAVMLTQRVFLTHLQEVWRRAVGLGPPRNLYIVEKEPGLHEAIRVPEKG